VTVDWCPVSDHPADCQFRVVFPFLGDFPCPDACRYWVDFLCSGDYRCPVVFPYWAGFPHRGAFPCWGVTRRRGVTRQLMGENGSAGWRVGSSMGCGSRKAGPRHERHHRPRRDRHHHRADRRGQIRRRWSLP